MTKLSRILLTITAGAQLAAFNLQAATSYQLDNNNISTALNASEGTETLDNWFGNVFTILAGGNLITSVDFGVFTSSGAPGSGSVVLYKVTGAGGNPALGATRLYTQTFTPLTGDNTNAFLQTINLTTPVLFNTGDKMLVAIMLRNVDGNPPNDVYPYLLDSTGSGAGTYWDRANPGTFNLDDLSAAKPIDQPLSPGGFAPGPDHIIIRASAIPEPSTLALGALGALGALMLAVRRGKK